MATPESSAPALEAFLDKALPRIRRFMCVLGVAGILFSLVFFRWPATAGFIVGGTISYINQHWLEQAIEALGERITAQKSKERGGLIVVRAMLRYALIAAGAYVIFNVSLVALYGFLAGVCLPIAAVACEVAAELFITLRRGT